MSHATKKATRALALRLADEAARSSLDGLAVASALMVAAINVSFRAGMTRDDIADWLRRLAEELDYGAQVRAALRK